MGILTKIETYLSGKKTFILVLSAIGGIVLAVANGDMTMVDAVPAAWVALTAGALRSGMNKTNPPV